MTVQQWEDARNHNKKIFGDKFYPIYKSIAKAKQKCYPDNMEVAEDGASVDLQSFVDHTSHRLYMTFSKSALTSLKGKNAVLMWKIGMDGTTNNRDFQQKSKENDVAAEEDMVESEQQNEDVEQAEEDSEVESDGSAEEANEKEQPEALQNDLNLQKVDFESVLNFSGVPLELKCGRKIVWKNSRPSPLRLCRPIKFKFIKELIDNIQIEYLRFNKDLKK